MGARSTSAADSPSLKDSTMAPTGSGDVGEFPATSAQEGGLGDLSNRAGVYDAS